jgi:hypothetical protein
LAATLEFRAARVKATSRSSTARPHLVAAAISVFCGNYGVAPLSGERDSPAPWFFRA